MTKEQYHQVLKINEILTDLEELDNMLCFDNIELTYIKNNKIIKFLNSDIIFNILKKHDIQIRQEIRHEIEILHQKIKKL